VGLPLPALPATKETKHALQNGHGVDLALVVGQGALLRPVIAPGAGQAVLHPGGDVCFEGCDVVVFLRNKGHARLWARGDGPWGLGRQGV
jgi:hypothetical protein